MSVLCNESIKSAKKLQTIAQLEKKKTSTIQDASTRNPPFAPLNSVCLLVEEAPVIHLAFNQLKCNMDGSEICSAESSI